jgi:DNA polymerase
LSRHRRQAVFGAGNPDAELLFVGEAPGEEEDRRGLPFVGRAGELLTRIIQAMGLRRQDVYIANILKCRPPGNRDPDAREIRNCSHFLWRQIEIIRPRVICALGGFASRTLLQSPDGMGGIGRLRGRFHDVRGIPVMPTYHPAYLLRNPSAKRLVWEDVKKIREFLNTSDPGRDRAEMGHRGRT